MSEVKRYWPEEVVGTGELVVYEQDYAALEAECGKLVERTGYLVEFAQQMARQQGEPYYRLLAKAALKKWSEP